MRVWLRLQRGHVPGQVQRDERDVQSKADLVKRQEGLRSRLQLCTHEEPNTLQGKSYLFFNYPTT